MSKYLAVAAFAGLLITATSASALPRQPQNTNEAAPATTPPKEAKAAKRETRYCIEHYITGSRIAQRDCRTREEWLSTGFDPLNP